MPEALDGRTDGETNEELPLAKEHGRADKITPLSAQTESLRPTPKPRGDSHGGLSTEETSSATGEDLT